jgi:hypothetical protein
LRTWYHSDIVTPMSEDTLLVKIAALLRKAESTTPEEAKALIAKAQELATLASIDIEMARSFVPKHERRETPVSEIVRIGEAGKMGLATYCDLFMSIGRTNDLKFNIAHNSTYVVAFGFPSDIATTKVLYASLLAQMVDGSNKFLATGEHKTETTWREYKDAWGDTHQGYKPVSGRTARISFQQTFALRIGARLREARQEAVSAAERAQTPVAALPPSPYFANEPEVAEDEHSVALVLKAKSSEVAEFYKSKSDAKGSWKGGSRGYSNKGASAGRSAADRARLSSPKGLGGSRGSLPRG